MKRYPALYSFLKVFIPLAAVLVAGLFLLDQYRETLVLEENRDRAAAGLSLESATLSQGMQGHAANALTLAQLVHHELNDHSEDENKYPHLPSLFLNFLQARPSYLGVRLFLSGRASAVSARRVSAGGPPVATQGRISDADRALYKQALSLWPGQVMVTPHLKQSANPAAPASAALLWRMAAPVKGSDGDRAGMLFMELDGGNLLDGARSRVQSGGGTLFVVDLDEGRIMKAETGQAWLSIPAGATPYSLKAALPEVWDRILNQQQGQFQTSQGLFTYATVNIRPPYIGEGAPGDSETSLLKMILHVPLGSLRPVTPYFSPLVAAPLLLILAALLWPWALARARRMVAEGALRESEQTVLALSETLRDAVVVVDQADRVRFWNPAAETMFGYKRGEAMGQAIRALLAAPGELEQGTGTLGYYLRSPAGQGQDGLYRFSAQRKDGSLFPAEASVSTLHKGDQQWTVGVMRDVTQRVATERKLVELATIDALTGLLNRRRFMEMAEEELLRAKRYDHPVSLLMMDLDLFKAVNDTHGHHKGDQVLQKFSQVAWDSLREVDVMGRIGGEEFAVLLPETDISRAMVAAERLRRAVEACSVPLDQGELRFTVSIGAAQALPGREKSLHELLKQADDALYAAKDTGRNRVMAA